MAEDGTKRGSDISQAGLTLIKSFHTMALSKRHPALPSDSEGGAQIRDNTESDGGGEYRKQTSSVPSTSVLNVDTGDENEVEEEEKKGDKEEVSGSNRQE